MTSTLAGPTGTDLDTPSWSARPHGGCAAALALFTEPDFYFRTAVPDTRPEWELLDILGGDSRLLVADGVPVGLYAWESAGSEHWSHQQLHLRLTAGAPGHWWPSAFEAVVAAARWHREIVRLTMMIGEFDVRGLRFARTAGLTAEGTLAGVVRQGGRSHGYVFHSRIWEPTREGRP